MNPPLKPLPLTIQLRYATGQLGWSTLINIVGLQLVYFYRPPSEAGLPLYISQITFFVVLNVVTLVAASGRLFDAITDPLIASWSDRLEHKDGRRIPFMRCGAFPAAFFCVLLFVPPVPTTSAWNIVWLVVIQLLFFGALTLYVAPYLALLPELGKTASERLNLSTWLSVGYALGLILAAQTPAIAAMFERAGVDTVNALQSAFVAIALLALIFLFIPILTIDERRYSTGQPNKQPLPQALRQTFRNTNFFFYVVADFSYFMAIALVNTGLLYYVTVLLKLDSELVSLLLAVMIIVSFLFYPLVNLLARRLGKKRLVVTAFVVMSVIFVGIYFLGRGTISTLTQAYMLAISYAIPLAFLSVLPNAVLADIAGHDALRTKEPKEGMYFATRALLQKFGQTLGIVIFAMLTTFGVEPGNDLGIRLSGLFGFALCLLAGLIFTRYNERRLLQEVEDLSQPT